MSESKLRLIDYDEIMNIEDITTKYPEFKRSLYTDNDNKIRCVITGLDLGIPIGEFDINGNEIFSNDLIYDINSHDPTAVIDVGVFDGAVSYGLSNYHCGHCTSFNNVVVIGVIDHEFNVVLYKDAIKDCEMGEVVR